MASRKKPSSESANHSLTVRFTEGLGRKIHTLDIYACAVEANTGNEDSVIVLKDFQDRTVFGVPDANLISIHSKKHEIMNDLTLSGADRPFVITYKIQDKIQKCRILAHDSTEYESNFMTGLTVFHDSNLLPVFALNTCDVIHYYEETCLVKAVSTPSPENTIIPFKIRKV